MIKNSGIKKTAVILVVTALIFTGCASTPVKDSFTVPGPHYLKAPEEKEVQTVGNVLGMLTGTAVGFLAGICAGILTYNAFYGKPDSTDKPNSSLWLCASGFILAIPGGIIGWNIPYGVIGLPSEADRKRELEKRTDEKIKNLFKDKNTQ